MNADFFRGHLENDLIPFWDKMRDNTRGGFYGYADHSGKPDPESVKGVILHSRILWFYSSAYILLKKPGLPDMAKHAYDFIANRCFDQSFGGVFWSVNADGSPCDDTKHTYNQAFAIYALSKYYRASKDRGALDLAYELRRTIEEKCRDKDGYLEAFDRDFTPTSNEKLSENGVMASRTMNTLLHVIEAYTELYTAERLPEVGISLRAALRLFKDKIYDPEKRICKVFFDLDYNSLIDLESYGHNIEASWLIDRACEALGDKDCTAQMLPITNALAETALKNAFDPRQNGLNNEREDDRVDAKKVWWVQAEAVIGAYNAYSKDPSRTEFLQAAEKILGFIQSSVIDPKTGEWIENVAADGNTDRTQALVHPWKCPYHNGRMCIEMITRMNV